MLLGKEESYRIIRAVLVAEYFVSDFLPHEEFLAKKIEELNLDNPPLPSDPDFEKKSLVAKIRKEYRKQKINLLVTEKLFKNAKRTLKNVVDVCSDPGNQEQIA